MSSPPSFQKEERGKWTNYKVSDPLDSVDSNPLWKESERVRMDWHPVARLCLQIGPLLLLGVHEHLDL